MSASCAAGAADRAGCRAVDLSGYGALADGRAPSCVAAQEPRVADAAASSTGGSAESAARRGILGLLSKWEVWMHILNPFFWGACSSSVEALWPLLATTHAISDDYAALGVTLNGVGFLVSSIVTTLLGQRQYDRCLLYLLAAAMFGVCVLLVPAVPLVLGSYLALSTLSGWWLGVVVSLYMSVLSEAVETRDFAGAIALYNFMNGLGYFVGPIMIGSLGTHMGESTNWGVCGCFSIAASLMVIPPYIAFRWRQKAAATAATPSSPKSARGE